MDISSDPNDEQVPSVPSVPPAFIRLSKWIDWLMRWIFDFSGIETWILFGTCAVVGLTFYGVDGQVRGSENAHPVAVWMSDYLSGFGDLLKLESGHPNRGYGMAWIGFVLLLPFWIALRIAMLPFYFLGLRIRQALSP